MMDIQSIGRYIGTFIYVYSLGLGYWVKDIVAMFVCLNVLFMCLKQWYINLKGIIN